MDTGRKYDSHQQKAKCPDGTHKIKGDRYKPDQPGRQDKGLPVIQFPLLAIKTHKSIDVIY